MWSYVTVYFFKAGMAYVKKYKDQISYLYRVYVPWSLLVGVFVAQLVVKSTVVFNWNLEIRD